jgi:hypothetical protein
VRAFFDPLLELDIEAINLGLSLLFLLHPRSHNPKDKPHDDRSQGGIEQDFHTIVSPIPIMLMHITRWSDLIEGSEEGDGGR